MRIVSSNPNIAENRSYVQELEARLHHGDQLIRQLEAQKQPVDHLVQHWLTLLREYEEAFRAEQNAA